MSIQMGPIYDARDYAGFWRRTLAMAIDGIILFSGFLGTVLAWTIVAPDAWVTEQAYGRIFMSFFILGLLYSLGLRFTPEGTLGYRLVGIRYASMVDGKPPVWRILFRSVAAVALLTTFALDHIWILFDERKQAWHDKMSGFYVVKRRAQPLGTQQVVQRVINFMGVTFIVWEPAGADQHSEPAT